MGRLGVEAWAGLCAGAAKGVERGRQAMALVEAALGGPHFLEGDRPSRRKIGRTEGGLGAEGFAHLVGMLM